MLLGITSNDLPYPNDYGVMRGWVMVSLSIIGCYLPFFLSGLRNTLSRERMGASMRQERQVASRILQKISEITI